MLIDNKSILNYTFSGFKIFKISCKSEFNFILLFLVLLLTLCRIKIDLIVQTDQTVSDFITQAVAMETAMPGMIFFIFLLFLFILFLQLFFVGFIHTIELPYYHDG